MAGPRLKVPFPVRKEDWHPSLIPGPIVLVSTYGPTGVPNIAPKSWVQMISFDPPLLMFSGTRGNATEKNVMATGCFGVNLVDSSMTAKVFECIQWHGEERIRRTGFRLIPASSINAPLVEESKACLECRLHGNVEAGSALVVFGEIVAAWIWDEIARAEPGRKYELLDQALFLEDGLYARITKAHRAGGQ